jgi:hypothetical protein
MPYETDFDSALTILLGKAVGATTTTPVAPTTGSTTTTGVATGIAFVIDGGGSGITAGSKGGIMTPFPGTITKVELQEFEGVSGSITVDIQAGVPGNGPTFASLCAGSFPQITSGRHYSDSVLSGWSTFLDRGVALKYVVSGVSGFTRLTVMLFIRRTDV